MTRRYSFRDPVTHVLKAQGFVASNQSGDVRQEEAEDFSLDPGAWQWNGSAWVAYTPPPAPDARGFEVSLHETFPGQAFVAFAKAFDLSWLFYAALQSSNWPQLQAMVQLALAEGKITQEQYDALKAAAAANYLPVSL